jgi:ABC-type multidrug transport system ATPase subunit
MNININHMIEKIEEHNKVFIYVMKWMPDMLTTCAGKSTLLDLLANYKKLGKVEGKIYMNGRSIGKRFKRVSAYVSQEDVFVPTMSAWETLRFHASLRLGNSLTATEQCDRMTDVLKIMGLWRSKDTQVRSLAMF